MVADAKQAIRDTVARFCGDADPGALLRIAQRESAFHPDAIGDKTIAPAVYEKQRDRLRAEGNPYADDPGRWGGSFGLFQLMAPYMVRLWNPKADPYVLFRPDIATVCAGRLWNRAVAAGAKDFVEVRLVWAFGPSGLKYTLGSEPYDKRIADKWSIVDGVINPSARRYRYDGFGKGPTDGQAERLDSGGASSLPPVAAATAWAAPAMLAAAAYMLTRGDARAH